MVVEDGKILDVMRSPRSSELPSKCREESGFSCPGFIDLQINGAFGIDVVELGRFGGQIFTTQLRLLPLYLPRNPPGYGSPEPSAADAGCRTLRQTRIWPFSPPPW